EHRKRAEYELAVLIEFHAAPDRRAVAVEDDIFEPRRPAAPHEGERRPRRRLLRLAQSGDQVIELGLGKIRFDRQPAVRGAAQGTPAADLARDRPDDGAAGIEAESRARRIVEGARHAHLGVRLAGGPAQLHRSWRAADAHVALDLVALIVGAGAQSLRL